MENSSTAPAFILASLLTSYPNEDFSQNIRVLLEDEDLTLTGQKLLGSKWENFREDLKNLCSSNEDLEAIKSEYIDLFDRGRSINSLYETEYGRARAAVKGNELVDIAGFYKAFGLDLGGEGTQPEMVDHIGVELEFYGLLLLKDEALRASGNQEGVEIVEDARKKFLKSHLGAFASALPTRPGISESPYFAKVFDFCGKLVREECQDLGVETEALSWIGFSEGEGAEVCCGGTVGTKN